VGKRRTRAKPFDFASLDQARDRQGRQGKRTWCGFKMDSRSFDRAHFDKLSASRTGFAGMTKSDTHFLETALVDKVTDKRKGLEEFDGLRVGTLCTPDKLAKPGLGQDIFTYPELSDSNVTCCKLSEAEICGDC